MSAELSRGPRPPINYRQPVRTGSLPYSLEALERTAWNFRDLGSEIVPERGKDLESKLSRVLGAIQKLIIEQYGLPKRG